jgi:D-alanyl-D-alanine carboxypeptidase
MRLVPTPARLARALLGAASLSLAVGCGGDPCRDVQVPAGTSLQATAQAVLDACLQAQGAPGGVVVVARGQDVGVAVAGKARGDGTPLTPGHLVRVGSVTKSVTAALVLHLAEQGRLSLDDTLESHVPGIPNGPRITLTHLLQMTSGLVSYTDLKEFGEGMARPWTREELLALVKAQKPAAEPGATWKYNNTNYFLLGLVVEQVTGRPFDAVLDAELLAPTGLSADVGLEGSERLEAGRLAAGFTAAGEEVADPLDPDLVNTAGALVGTPEALMRLLGHLGDGWLDAASVERMRTPGPVQGFWEGLSGRAYGMGLWQGTVEGREVWGHPGGHPSGAVAYWLVEPRADVRVLVQFDTLEADAFPTAEAALRAVLQSAPPAP